MTVAVPSVGRPASYSLTVHVRAATEAPAEASVVVPGSVAHRRMDLTRPTASPNSVSVAVVVSGYRYSRTRQPLVAGSAVHAAAVAADVGEMPSTRSRPRG